MHSHVCSLHAALSAFLPRWFRCAIIPVIAASFALVDVARAADAATGTIEGRVLNAANGTYLSKARVVVEGTSLETLTNDFGEFRINNVPAGTRQLRVTYTGQSPRITAVTVPAGAAVSQDVQLGAEANSTVQLNPFVVESERYRTGQEIAINEERYSVNIKNVVSADQFGEIPSGNVGEFIKFLPGVEIEYGGTYIAPTDAFGVSVRGFGAEDTAIYIDGVPIASAPQASLTNQVGLDMMSINNASRVELIKVATPDMPMNSIGGQINLISKSAFEYSKPSFSLRTYVTINSENPNPFERIPGPGRKKVFAGQPGIELTYIKPVSKTLGFSLTASSYNQYSENRRLRPEWGTTVQNVDLRAFGGANNTVPSNALGPVSLANPYFTRLSLTDAPRTSSSHSASLKADWKPLQGLALSGSYQISVYESADNNRRIQIRTEAPMSWDSTSTISYPYVSAADSASGSQYSPRNTSLEMTPDARDKEGITHTGSIRATYRRGPWDIYALASASTSRVSFKDRDNGHFSTLDIRATVGQVKFEDIADGVPHRVTVLDRNGDVLDYTKLENWSDPEILARSGVAESMDDKFNYKLDVKRELDFLPWDFARFAFKTGFLREETVQKKWGLGVNYRESYIGPDLTISDNLDTSYLNQDPGFGFAPQQWFSLYELYDVYKSNPAYFTVTEADAVNNWNNVIGQNKSIKDVKNAWYALIEGSALRDNRLNFVIGLRSENSKRTGRGPQVDSKWNYIKNDDGTLYRNVGLVGGQGTVRLDQAASPLFAQNTTGSALRSDLTAKGIEFPTAPIASNSLTGAMMQRLLNRPVHGESNGKPSYSVNFSYRFTPKLTGQVAWSRTFGRIPIEDGGSGGLITSGNNFTINENENITAIPRGTIRVANPNLKPEISDNWDFALKYYTDSGGKLAASYYTKKVRNFSDTFVTTSTSPEFGAVIESLGLDPADYQDWQLTTALNGIGTGKTSGYELEAFQDLRFLHFLGDWGRRTNVFATYTKTKRSETNTTRISARPAASQLATAGINVAFNRLIVNMRATWRDLTFTRGVGNFTINGQTVQLGEYEPSATKVDLSLSYQLTKRYSVYASGRNIFATGLRKERMDLLGIYPAYAHWDDIREFGVQWTVGIRGQF